jgi:hypothetical protein
MHYIGHMSKKPSKINLKEKYILSKCCSPGLEDRIVGYFSYDDMIKVHRHDCSNLSKSDSERLVDLNWSEIKSEDDFTPGEDYVTLEPNDFAIIKLHREYGVDYSLKVARMLNLPKQEVFDRHKKLRAMGILERVKPLIIRYRKGVVDNKWIKHRNHTYYDLTEMGNRYLDYHIANHNK